MWNAPPSRPALVAMMGSVDGGFRKGMKWGWKKWGWVQDGVGNEMSLDERSKVIEYLAFFKGGTLASNLAP
jgi:hypothetical protein